MIPANDLTGNADRVNRRYNNDLRYHIIQIDNIPKKHILEKLVREAKMVSKFATY